MQWEFRHASLSQSCHPASRVPREPYSTFRSIYPKPTAVGGPSFRLGRVKRQSQVSILLTASFSSVGSSSASEPMLYAWETPSRNALSTHGALTYSSTATKFGPLAPHRELFIL